MADIKISELQEVQSVNDEDIVMIVQGGVNKKASVSKIKATQLKATTLYDYADGAAIEDFYITGDTEEYDYLEIYYYVKTDANEKRHGSIKISNPYGKYANLSVNLYADNQYMEIINQALYINHSQIIASQYLRLNFTSSGFQSMSTNKSGRPFYITKVLGIK